MKTEVKYAIGGVAMITLATGVVLGVRYFKKRNQRKRLAAQNSATSLFVSEGSQSLPNASKIAGSFPLAKWTGGAAVSLVEELQEALLNISSVSDLIRTSGGADGKLGNQTEKAILQLGFNLPLNSGDYAKIIALSNKPEVIPKTPVSQRKTVATARGRRFVSTQ